MNRWAFSLIAMSGLDAFGIAAGTTPGALVTDKSPSLQYSSMMCIMLESVTRMGFHTRMRYAAEIVAEKRRDILHKASGLFRQHGFTRVSVSDVMKSTGLTHGAFYSHFKSKDELIEHSLDHASSLNREGLPPEGLSAKALLDYLQKYLSNTHRDDRAAGCLMAALGSEVSRQQIGKAAFTAHVKAVLESIEGPIAASSYPSARSKSIEILATMVGALTLARAVSDPRLSDEILDEMRSALSASDAVSDHL